MLNPWPEPKLKLNDNNLLPLPDEEVVSEDELEAPSRDDLDTDSEDGHDNKIEVNASMSLDDTIIDHEIEAYEQDTDKIETLCTFLEKYKPTKECIEKRETILNYLETGFRKKYPNCSVRAYGSFYNGFGFQLSDLDTCDIGDASHGTLSSYAYIIMVIHFLQQIQPPVVPILQQLNDNQSTNTSNVRKYADWNIYFYDDLTQLNKVWNGYGLNKLSSGELWIELLRYYTELFDYEKNIVTIRQYEPLSRLEKGWFRQTIAIEDPFILTHNLADALFLKSKY
ncbi:unnamed protein product [Rotaria sp. Silwood1]|nr:unnamed protein product [Rotaria sp. Silwood1]CAF1356703.1 unnamed protein product [Rotaria sp. Silwood1]CAF3547825.1 unnamed protein product [Rotaria sp. Silwood1]